MLILGIDPGKNGGLAWIDTSLNTVSSARKMPATEADVWAWFKVLLAFNAPDECFAYIEKVGAMPGQGVTSMFSFGQNYGMLRAFLIAAGIPFEAVAPGVWQRGFNLPSGKKVGGTAKKNAHKARAQELYPGLKITHATADALLIATYGARKRRAGPAEEA